MDFRKRKCSSCGEQKDESEFVSYRSGNRPCKACEQRRVVNHRWRNIPLIKLRQEVEIETKRLEQKKIILADRMAEWERNH